MFKIAVLVFDGCWATQVFLVHDLCHVANTLAQEENLFTVTALGTNTKAITTSTQQSIFPEDIFDTSQEYDAFIIPAIEGKFLTMTNLEHERIAQFLKIQLKQKKTIVSFSTGAYFLAKTELLKATLLTTHWAFVNTIQRLYPSQALTGKYVYLCHENIYTTSSFKGCVDSLLKLIENYKGKSFAQLCSSYFLMDNTPNHPPQLPIYRKHKNQKINQIQDWLDDNYNVDINVSELATLFGYSERTLQRHFQTAATISILQYQQFIRLQKAKQLMLETNLSIQNIAYQIGYENVSFFIRLFKKHVHCTPAVWRENKNTAV